VGPIAETLAILAHAAFGRSPVELSYDLTLVGDSTEVLNTHI
jgi:hypothetical protein